MDRKLRHNKPRLLLMGQRRYSNTRISNGMTLDLSFYRSGKSSITSVVFHKMPPQETLFLESTTRIQKDSMQLVLPRSESRLVSPQTSLDESLYCALG